MSFLNLAYCSNIGDTSITRLAECCSGMKSLCLVECQNITENSIIEIAERCLKMEIINVLGK
jgi:F-box and leucine-rich repeat protein 1 (S-phase kinase-associated protein 2)